MTLNRALVSLGRELGLPAGDLRLASEEEVLAWSRGPLASGETVTGVRKAISGGLFDPKLFDADSTFSYLKLPPGFMHPWLARHGVSVPMPLLPVAPPSIRPLESMGLGRKYVPSLNFAYRAVIATTGRYARLAELEAPDAILQFEIGRAHARLTAFFDQAPEDAKNRLGTSPGGGRVLSLREEISEAQEAARAHAHDTVSLTRLAYLVRVAGLVPSWQPTEPAFTDRTRPFWWMPVQKVSKKVDEQGAIVDGLRHGPWRGTYGHGVLAWEGEYLANERTGEWRFLDEDGVPVASGPFDQGQKSGDWTELEDRRGFLVRIRSLYRDGRRHGPAEEFWPRDTTMIGEYKEGLKVGLWVGYYREPQGVRGPKRVEGDYLSGKRSGPWTFFHENGLPSATGNYVDDQKHGAWTSYRENGKPWRNRIFSRGVEAGHEQASHR